MPDPCKDINMINKGYLAHVIMFTATQNLSSLAYIINDNGLTCNNVIRHVGQLLRVLY